MYDKPYLWYSKKKEEEPKTPPDLELVYQITVSKQIGNTCGYHGIYHAVCIAEQLIGGIVLRRLRVTSGGTDPFFVSTSQDVYVEGRVGEWRKLIEDQREKFGLEGVDLFSDMLSAHEIELIMREKYPNLVYLIYNSLSRAFEAGVIKGKVGLLDSINTFKTDPERKVLPIIMLINTSKGLHWVVDVLYKRDDGAIQHVLADSDNKQIENDQAIQEVIEMTKG